MAIVLPHGRPAIDIEKGSYARPENEWAYLGDPDPRARLEAAIAAVGRVDYVGHPHLQWDGTAFVVGKDLLMTPFLETMQLNGDRYAFKPGQSGVVDFGHERRAAKSLRVRLEEVVEVDSRWSVLLMRAALPDTITPLSLSTLDPEALGERDVVLLGYPAWDQRNDPALMQQVFRGVVDVKRMLPGRLRGRRPYPFKGGQRDALAHDCTSTGGCGNAPLVDVLTGHVVGVQFAGRYLDINYAGTGCRSGRESSVRARRRSVRRHGRSDIHPRRGRWYAPSGQGATGRGAVRAHAGHGTWHRRRARNRRRNGHACARTDRVG